MNLNKAFVLGNVTRDPEVRSMPNGNQVTNFSMATNRVWKDAQGQKKEEAEFHNIVCYGKLADISARYLNKGSLVLIEGRIKTRNWTNSQGIKQYRTEIIAESMQLGPKGAGSPNASRTSNYGKSFSRPEPEQPNNPTAGGDEIPVIEENYPLPQAELTSNSPKETPFEGDAADEIDVRDIPF